MKNLILTSVLICLSFILHAQDNKILQMPDELELLGQKRGVAANLTVINIRVDYTGKGFVRFDQNLIAQQNTTIPECVNTQYYSSVLAFDTNTAGGKSALSMFLTAKSTGKKVTAYGRNICDIYGSIESFAYGYLLQ